MQALTVGLVLVCVVFAPVAALPAYAAEDEFGIEKLYSTDGDSWYIDEDHVEDAMDDGDSKPFRIGGEDNMEDFEDEGDGTWKMDVTTGTEEHGTRMHVYHPDGDDWEDVEMSGYFKVEDGDDQITMVARHGKDYHEDGGCEAMGYYAMVSMDGDAYFKKKLHHEDGGYSDKVAEEENAVDDLEDEWIGLKFVVYNTGDDEVKLELYADEGDEGNDWKLLTEYTDDGDLEVHERDCDRDKDHVIVEGQPRVSWRIDDSEFKFKKLSVREIDD